jgi:alanine racemase
MVEKTEGSINNLLTTPNSKLQTPEGRKTWAEVDLGALAKNYRALDSLLFHSGSPAIHRPRIIPVIKAHAYGHGMIPVAHALADAGATVFAVGVVEEGTILRQAGISQEILVMGTAWQGQESDALRHQLTLAVDAPESVHRLESAAAGLAVNIPVHIKVDTGMGRLGVRWDLVKPLLNSLQLANHVTIAGTFSHLSSADERDPAFTLEQIRKFECALHTVRESGLDPGEIHLANSAGLLFHERLRQWSARTGIALYGYSLDSQHSPVKLCPILSLKTKIAFIRMLEAGEPLGYNRRFTASRKTRIAVLPLGYADGFDRRLGGCGRVIVQDRWAEVVGAVSMDMITVDITNLPDVQIGDEAIILGSSAHCHIYADDWAEQLETIPYEILCGIAPRVPRIYAGVKPDAEYAEKRGR